MPYQCAVTTLPKKIIMYRPFENVAKTKYLLAVIVRNKNFIHDVNNIQQTLCYPTLDQPAPALTDLSLRST